MQGAIHTNKLSNKRGMRRQHLVDSLRLPNKINVGSTKDNSLMTGIVAM